MTNELPPQWAQLRDPVLSQAMAGVWQRLPEDAQATLDAIGPKVLVVSRQQFTAMAVVKDDMAFTSLAKCDGANGNGSMRVVVVVNRKLITRPDGIIRYILAHEFAHAVLRHWEFGYIAPAALMSDQERTNLHTWNEEHADWLVVRIWGFVPEFNEFVADLNQRLTKRYNLTARDGRLLRCRWMRTWHSEE